MLDRGANISNKHLRRWSELTLRQSLGLLLGKIRSSPNSILVITLLEHYALLFFSVALLTFPADFSPSSCPSSAAHQLLSVCFQRSSSPDLSPARTHLLPVAPQPRILTHRFFAVASLITLTFEGHVICIRPDTNETAPANKLCLTFVC